MDNGEQTTMENEFAGASGIDAGRIVFGFTDSENLTISLFLYTHKCRDQNLHILFIINTH